MRCLFAVDPERGIIDVVARLVTPSGRGRGLTGRVRAVAGSSGVRWWLLLGLGLMSLALVGALVYGRLAGSAAPSPVAQPVGGGVSARQAFVPAAELAVQWQADAGLAAVSCHRPAAGVRLGGEVEWAFQFFSPSIRRLALITVTEGAARMVREGVSPYAVPTFSTEVWRVDSDQALQTWWNRGGSSLVARRPDADLAMQLRMPDEGGEQPVWTVVGLVSGAETTFTVVVDATSGALVE